MESQYPYPRTIDLQNRNRPMAKVTNTHVYLEFMDESQKQSGKFKEMWCFCLAGKSMGKHSSCVLSCSKEPFASFYTISNEKLRKSGYVGLMACYLEKYPK